MDQPHTHSADSLIRLIASDPLNLRAYHLLAKVYEATGELRKAELVLHRAIEIGPLRLDTWTSLGIVYSDLGDWVRSADAFEQASALDPQDPESWIGYGMALIEIRDMRRAADVRDRLLERFPSRSESHLVAGHISKVHGRVQEAADSYRRALQLDPHQTDAIFNLVDILPPEPGDPFTLSLENFKRDSSLSPRQTANLNFALARIHERAGQADLAFALYKEANAAADAMMRSLGTAYDPQELEAERDGIVAMFRPEVFAHQLEPLDLDMKMIFVVGMPRSGTTLVEQILSRHSRVSTGGELPFMQDCLLRLRAARKSRAGTGQIRLDDEKEKRLLIELRERYLDAVFERDLDDEYVVDKLPANFSALGLIRVLFPDSVIVHCTRDPVATCWSLYSAYFGTHIPYKTSLEHLVHYYKKVYLRLMAHWKSVLEPGIIDVDYESLTAMPDTAVRELLRRCGLPWEDACLSTSEHGQPIYTASMLQARQPIYTTSTSRWHAFETHLWPLIAGLRDFRGDL